MLVLLWAGGARRARCESVTSAIEFDAWQTNLRDRAPVNPGVTGAVVATRERRTRPLGRGSRASE
jgi:hypothetical protein